MKLQHKLNQIEQRTAVFMDLIPMIWKLNDAGIRELAKTAGIHWTTLYNWRSAKVTHPSIRTLYTVANALGYDIRLVRQYKARLRSVK